MLLPAGGDNRKAYYLNEPSKFYNFNQIQQRDANIGH
jgi:hypothetical protein